MSGLCLYMEKKTPVLLNFPAPRRMEEERERVQASATPDSRGISRDTAEPKALGIPVSRFRLALPPR